MMKHIMQQQEAKNANATTSNDRAQDPAPAPEHPVTTPVAYPPVVAPEPAPVEVPVAAAEPKEPMSDVKAAPAEPKDVPAPIMINGWVSTPVPLTWLAAPEQAVLRHFVGRVYVGDFRPDRLAQFLGALESNRALNGIILCWSDDKYDEGNLSCALTFYRNLCEASTLLNDRALASWKTVATIPYTTAPDKRNLMEDVADVNGRRTDILAEVRRYLAFLKHVNGDREIARVAAFVASLAELSATDSAVLFARSAKAAFDDLTRLPELEAENARLKDEVKSMQGKIDCRDLTLKIHADGLRGAGNELEEMKVENARLKDEVRWALVRNEDLECRVAEKDRVLKMRLERLEVLNAEIAQLKVEVRRAQGRNEDLECWVAEKDIALQLRIENLEELNAEIARLKDEAASMQGKINGLETDAACPVKESTAAPEQDHIDMLLIRAFCTTDGWERTCSILCEVNVLGKACPAGSFVKNMVAHYLRAIVLAAYKIPLYASVNGIDTSAVQVLSLTRFYEIEDAFRTVFSADALLEPTLVLLFGRLLDVPYGEAERAAQTIQAHAIYWFVEHIGHHREQGRFGVEFASAIAARTRKHPLRTDYLI